MVEIKEENGNVVCIFHGKLDTVACLQVEKEVLEHARTAKGTVSFDLAEVTFVVSMFLRLCIQICKNMGANRFFIINTCPAVHKVFQMAGLDTLIAIK